MMSFLSFHRKNRNQRGFTLTEAIIVLGVMGMIVAAIWAAMSETRNRNSINLALSHILQITQNMRSLFVSQSTFDGGTFPTGTDITQQMIRSEVVPPAMINTANPAQLVSPWGTRVRITVGTLLRRFIIHFDGPLPTAICRSLVSSAGGPAHDPGLVVITPSVGGPIAGAAINTLTNVTAPNCTFVSYTFEIKG